jgi:hypothetical protein
MSDGPYLLGGARSDRDQRPYSVGTIGPRLEKRVRSARLAAGARHLAVCNRDAPASTRPSAATRRLNLVDVHTHAPTTARKAQDDDPSSTEITPSQIGVIARMTGRSPRTGLPRIAWIAR